MAAPSPIRYRPMRPGEEQAVVALVLRVFDATVAPLYSSEGVAEFGRYVQADRLAERAAAGHFVLLALDAEDRLTGAIEVRGCEHVSLLFVDPARQQQGIARELLARALALCRRQRPGSREVTVNSSPNAVEAYRRLGFRPLDRERTVNGIRFTPMALPIALAGETEGDTT